MRDEDINEGWYPRVARFLAGTSEDNRGEVRLQGRPLPTDVDRELLVKARRRVAHALAAAAGNRLEHQRQRCEQEARGRATILLMSTALVQSFRINFGLLAREGPRWHLRNAQRRWFARGPDRVRVPDGAVAPRATYADGTLPGMRGSIRLSPTRFRPAPRRECHHAGPRRAAPRGRFGLRTS